MKNLMIAVLMMLSASAFATDAYSYKNLGFSADGRYFAFVESVVQDGSGFPSARGQVIDVAANRTVVAKRVVLQNESATEKQALNKVMSAMNLPAYGIDGRNKGETLWVRMQTDLTPAASPALFSTNYWVDGGASSVSPKFELHAIELPAPVNQEECFGGEPAKMLKLTLLNLTAGSRADLQVDTNVPAMRKCSWGYQVRQVIKYKASIAAVLRYETFGFEGPDYSHMAVTGANALN